VRGGALASVRTSCPFFPMLRQFIYSHCNWTKSFFCLLGLSSFFKFASDCFTRTSHLNLVGIPQRLPECLWFGWQKPPYCLCPLLPLLPPQHKCSRKKKDDLYQCTSYLWTISSFGQFFALPFLLRRSKCAAHCHGCRFKYLFLLSFSPLSSLFFVKTKFQRTHFFPFFQKVRRKQNNHFYSLAPPPHLSLFFPKVL